MSTAAAASAPAREERAQRKFGPMFGAVTIGLPLAGAILWVLLYGPLAGTSFERYVRHPAECVEIVMFGMAVGALLGKLLGVLVEMAASRRTLLPAWDGKPVPVSEAGPLLDALDKQPGWLRSTYLGGRVHAVLEFLNKRGSATELDDQLRTLTDNDAMAMESSYGLTRFITWAMPILGFLGTVLGITTAIAGVSPEEMEKGLTKVTDGLSEAFDTTALALGLTMLVMFISFLVERLEGRMLEAVDRFVEKHLAHRWQRAGAAGGEMVEMLRHQSDTLVAATQTLVEKQAAVWAKALEEANRRQTALLDGLKGQLAEALETALERSLQAHARRLAELEKQAVGPATILVERLNAVSKTADTLATQAEMLAEVQRGGHQLVKLQQVMQQNLATLADAGSFQQAVHSLTAAIHLLTAQSSMRRPGAAA